MGAASVCSVWWHSEGRDWDVVWRRRRRVKSAACYHFSVVIAARSGVAIRTPSYLISGLRCLCHNLKEN